MAQRARITPANLTTMKATKPAAVAAPAPVPIETAAAARSNNNRKGQTLRLTVDAWKQLKHMATDEDKTAHDLMTEAVNMLFRDRGKPPIA